ncbi:PH domain-containing protein [Brachybacterium aquaticum]|uniref:Low molecular weight protein antigen 6 PH domain-containing protein n=1 Tax=Brachybacterium aquaticum TaxID=1432564 RepID=A0A841ADI9_9MICO|nr:PH domain-containing protein [Brachybacterium aquaticum]MBB5831158.1 hypothetical protein [Brachybacterium aquaticum]
MSADESRVLYVARPAPWVRAVTLGVGVLVVLILGATSLAVLGSDPGSPLARAAALLLVLPSALAVAVLIGLGQRMRFTVTTAGVLIRTMFRTRRIPWEQIARIEVDTGWVHQGQTVAVLHDGRRIRAPITEARSAMRRGESTWDHGPDLTAPARPTRAAIDAHRRWLRGEFAGSR